MKFLAIGDEGRENRNCLYGHFNVKEVYVFNNPRTQENPPTKSGETFIGVWPKDDGYTHWQLERHCNETESQLKRQDIYQDRDGLKKPTLRVMGIRQDRLIEITKDLNLTTLSGQTGISVDHLLGILEIAKPKFSKAG